MGFEKTIINDVKEVLVDSKPYFYNGTLFIDDINNDEANTVLEVLKSNYNGQMFMSTYAHEYAYDFC